MYDIRHTTTSIRATVLIIILGFSIPLSLFAPKALAPLLAILWLPILRLKPRYITVFFAVFLLFIVWTLFRALITPDAWTTMQLWARVALLGLAGYACVAVYQGLEEEYRLRMGKTLVIAYTLALLFCAVEMISGNMLLAAFRETFTSNTKVIEPNMLNRGICFLALMFWPMALGLGRWFPNQPWLAVILWVPAFIIIAKLESMAATLAMIGATSVFLWVKLVPSFLRFAVPAGVLTLVIATPFVMTIINPNELTSRYPTMPESTVHRLHIWKFAATNAWGKPLLGYGFNSSAYIHGGRENIVVNGRMVEGSQYMPGHPHNAVMQVWLELGAIGLVLYIAMLWMLMTSVLRNPHLGNNGKAAFLAVGVAYLIIGNTAFGIWQNWWIGAGFLALAAVAAVAYDPRPEEDETVTSL